MNSGFRLPAQVLLWAIANSLAGTMVGLAVGAFLEQGIDPRLVLVSVLFGNVVGFTVLIANSLLSPRLRGAGPVTRALLLGLALLSGSAAGTALVFSQFPLFVLRDLRQAIAVVSINGVLALIVGGVAHAYEGLRWRLAETLREVQEVRLVEAELRGQAARAELAALQARINPHFFFNTLNTISALIEDDPRRAGEVVQRLADLFRYTFRAVGTRTVTLQDEVRFIEKYLAIEQARFGDRLRVVWAVDAAALATPVPGLILQPLVENAVGHGVAPGASGGTVTIAARLEDATLRIEVTDDGRGPAGDPEELFREGHGLANVRGRLRTMYGEAGSLTLRRPPGGRGAVARLRIPAAAPAVPAASVPR